MTNFGGTPQEWQRFSETLGLTADLLPVVSNPNVLISETSRLKALGKVPSIYNSHSRVVGLPEWTKRVATANEIDEWSKEPDYGICIQTRRARALDIDVDDHAKAKKIVECIDAQLGIHLPVRFRANSGKCLLAYVCAGEFPKQTMRVEGGIVEHLRNGQQFIAAGTHSSGYRYEWDWRGNDSFPELTQEQVEALWQALGRDFALTPPAEARLRNAKGTRQVNGAHEDEVTDFLWKNNLVLGTGKDGQYFIECPWKDGHSCDSGITETCYFCADDRYEQGHFKCLHASCADRKDDEFKEALGCGVSATFDDLSDDDLAAPMPVKRRDGEGSSIAPNGVYDGRPPFDAKSNGKVKASLQNIRMMIQCSQSNVEIAFDDFRDELMLRKHDEKTWRPFTDADYVIIREWLERDHAFEPVGSELMRDAALLISTRNRFDSAITWLSELEWDGVPRIDGFLPVYYGTEDTPYTRAVSAYMWTALAGRVMQPGVKADMVPVLIGKQGVGKSMGVSLLSPGVEFFTTVNLMDRDEDQARRMRGKLVIELAELRGLNGRDNESIKEFITRTHEEWVPKYREFAKQYPRRALFIATHNKQHFLSDTTGNRRWLPVRVVQADIKAIERDRLQLWAEGCQRFLRGGVAYQEAEKLAVLEHDEYRLSDVWGDRLDAWLDAKGEDLGNEEQTPRTRAQTQGLTMNEILSWGLGVTETRAQKAVEHKISDLLRERGFEQRRVRVEGGGRPRFWFYVNDCVNDLV